MKPSMLAKLDQLANRLVELDELLMSEGATSNMDSYRKMTREHSELQPLVAPQVSHFSQVPLRTIVKFWHSEHMLPV